MWNATEKIASKNPRVSKAKSGTRMVSSKSAFCESKKLRFIKDLKAKVLQSIVGKISVVGKLMIRW